MHVRTALLQFIEFHLIEIWLITVNSIAFWWVSIFRNCEDSFFLKKKTTTTLILWIQDWIISKKGLLLLLLLCDCIWRFHVFSRDLCTKLWNFELDKCLKKGGNIWSDCQIQINVLWERLHIFVRVCYRAQEQGRIESCGSCDSKVGMNFMEVRFRAQNITFITIENV